jgi:hypothetical protein
MGASTRAARGRWLQTPAWVVGQFPGVGLLPADETTRGLAATNVAARRPVGRDEGPGRARRITPWQSDPPPTLDTGSRAAYFHYRVKRKDWGGA